MKTSLKIQNPVSQSSSPLAAALQNLIAGKDSTDDRETIAEALYPLAKAAVHDTRANAHHDREDLGHDVLLQIIPRGILNDRQLCEMALASAADDRLLDRLKAQFCMRIRGRTIDLLRRQRIRRAEPFDDAKHDLIQAITTKFLKNEEVKEALQNALQFTVSEREILEQLIFSERSLKKTARAIGISQKRAMDLMGRARQFLRKEFGVCRQHSPRPRLKS